MKYDPKDFLAQTALKSLGFYKGELDGRWGEKSRQSLAAWETHERDVSKPAATGERTLEFDSRTARNIATLCQPAQFAASKFMRAIIPAMAKHGLVPKITSGTRTYAEQDALYAQGRSAPGPTVTNARAGYSNHNFGLSWDITLFDASGTPVWDSPHYHECALIGEAQGLDCGAFWKSLTDEPHYGLKTGLTLAQMRDRMAKHQPIV